ncbi:MAG: RHS repeat-associated core domain-containing protein [Bacteroidota bacterium]
MGKLIEKNIHQKPDGSFLQSVDMRYHPRGWLESINDPFVGTSTDEPGENPDTGEPIPGADDDLFAQRLIYDQQVNLSDHTIYQRQHNGNIAGQIWRTGYGQPHAYFYSYDEINQLLYADYLVGEKAGPAASSTPWQRYATGIGQAKPNTSTSNPDHYDSAFSYDLNGNIQSATRYGEGTYDEASGKRYRELIDELTYGYDPQAGNRLRSVREQATHTDGMDFTERAIPSVFITQVRYHNEGTGNRQQYIKLTNMGETAMDLSGWELLTYAGEAYQLEPVALPAGGSVIIAGDQTGSLSSRYEENPDRQQFQVLTSFPHTLTKRDALSLRDAQGRVQDLVAWGETNLYGSLWKITAHSSSDKALMRSKIQALPWPGGWSTGTAAPYRDTAQDLDFNGAEYNYDANGNMIVDANKGLRLEYNAMNLPTQASFIHGGTIKWEYSASGTKVSKTVTDENGDVMLIRNYSSGFVYERYQQTAPDQLQFFTTETGRARLLNTDRFRLEHDLTDHLGNVRVSFAYNPETDSVGLLQEDSYYPFGLKMEGLDKIHDEENKFTYNGKELADEHGLNWYHYGARFYDPALGRWQSTDPIAQFHSPYLGIGNNPVIYVDKDGNSITLSAAAIAGIVGFSVGAGIKVYEIYNKKGFSNWSWKDYGKVISAGGAGALIAATPAKYGWITGSLYAGSIGAAGEFIDQSLSEGPIDLSGIAKTGILTGTMYGISYPINYFGKFKLKSFVRKTPKNLPHESIAVNATRPKILKGFTKPGVLPSIVNSSLDLTKFTLNSLSEIPIGTVTVGPLLRGDMPVDKMNEYLDREGY